MTAAGGTSRLGGKQIDGDRAGGDRAGGDRTDGNRAVGNRTDGKGTAMGWAGATLVAATVTAGLMAGLFAAFSYAVMPGLGRASDLAFVDGMQRINVAILNGWFGICFGGALLFSVLAAVREQFEAAWVRWNVVRTVACTLAFGCLSWALVLHGRLGG
jgi:uncharacterized membrane protein